MVFDVDIFDDDEFCCCCACDGDEGEGDFDDDETSCVSSNCTLNDDKTPKKNIDKYLKKICFLLFTGWWW